MLFGSGAVEPHRGNSDGARENETSLPSPFFDVKSVSRFPPSRSLAIGDSNGPWILGAHSYIAMTGTALVKTG